MLYSQQFQYMMSGPNTLTQAPSQYAPNMGTLPNYPQSSHLRTYAQPRQAGVPHGTNHRRRHLRTQSLTGSTTSGAGVNASRGGSQSNRRRNRYAGDRSSQTLRSSPSNQTPPVGPAAAANGSSPASNDSYTTLTTAQRAEMARSMHLNPEQLGRVLRRIHQRDERALGMYEEGRVRRRYLDELDEHARYLLGMHARRRYLEELDTYESSPAPKGLDDQSDGRPEPKETEELMLNLECKICMSQAVDTVLLPCGHAILCRWCARQHLEWTVTPRPNPKGYGQCPLCRTPVKQKVCNMYHLTYSRARINS